MTKLEVFETRYKVDNSDDESREYRISANVLENNGEIKEFDSGVILDLEDDNTVAVFNGNTNGFLNMQLYGYHTSESRNAVFAAVDSFISDLARMNDL